MFVQLSLHPPLKDSVEEWPVMPTYLYPKEQMQSAVRDLRQYLQDPSNIGFDQIYDAHQRLSDRSALPDIDMGKSYTQIEPRTPDADLDGIPDLYSSPTGTVTLVPSTVRLLRHTSTSVPAGIPSQNTVVVQLPPATTAQDDTSSAPWRRPRRNALGQSDFVSPLLEPHRPARPGLTSTAIEEQQRLVNEQIWREQFAALPAIGARARRRATQRPCIEDAIRRAERLFIRQRTVEMRSGVRDSGTVEVFDIDEEGREDACVHLARSITFEGKMMLETESPLGAVIVEEVTRAGDGALAATQESDERRSRRRRPA
nr:hypothetical protein B0A51_02448 [Rachicladosporium sp. CCFEE 5018]